MKSDEYEVPDDVVEDVLNQLNEKKQAMKRKSIYPAKKDVADAVKASAASFTGKPEEFPQQVIERLTEEGYDTSFLTVKRIWRTYEELVRKKVIRDTLGVVDGVDG